MPTGDIQGWKQVYAEDFNTPVALGSFSSSSYKKRLTTYKGADTSGRGVYDENKVLSVSNGVLDWSVRTENGTHYVSGVVPHVAGQWGQQYGRYSYRFRAATMQGYKFVGILWPDSDNWAEGEVDFPEVGELTSTEYAYAALHRPGDLSSGKPSGVTKSETKATLNDNGWHNVTIEWKPDSITYWLDGAWVGTHTTGIPNTKFHLVFQVETNLFDRAIPDWVAGHVQVDWVTFYTRNGC
ncbi:glycoside hydrolase family 16 protein [Propionicicella superfundia]|uniref:glycoside hydrolase family 16 protein n=1 Tax=Propionicicella superfundia TaxID=348582 RepID=UPI0003FCEC09|nr:glycoside hydrolase family 16 protein [Propionicicella superfundia]